MTKSNQKTRSKGYPRRIEGRISEGRYQELHALLDRDSSLTMSELIRKILEKQPVTVRVKNSEMSEVLESLMSIHAQLHKIGINLNQVVKEYHGSNSSITKLLLGKKLHQEQLRIVDILGQLKSILSQLQLKWLSE